MQEKERNSGKENIIAIGMISSDKFAAQISPMIEPGLLKNPMCDKVCFWSKEYFEKYKKAPHSDIQKIYESYIETGNYDDELADLIEMFLENISNEYDRNDTFNEEFAIDETEKYLKLRKLELLKADINTCLRSKDITGAENIIREHKEIKAEKVRSVDVFSDKNEVFEAFDEDSSDTLFRLHGALGELIGDFTRGELLAFSGPAKRGKTFWMVEIAVKAVLRGYKVMFFSLEMPKNKMIQRILQNICGLPDEEKSVEIPRFVEGVENSYGIEYKMKKREALDAYRAQEKIDRLKMQTKGGDIRLHCAPAYSMNVSALKLEVRRAYDDGFVPDVIIVDYADIMMPENHRDYRHQIDDIWKRLRAMAQEFHCLAVTATHTKKETFDRNIRQGDASEDARKNNHVSWSIGLNQSPFEKSKGIIRLNMLFCRYGNFNPEQYAVVLQNLGIGKPYLDSKMLQDVEMPVDPNDKRGRK